MIVAELMRSYYPSVGGLEKFIYDRIKIYQNLNIEYKIICTDFTTEKIDRSKIHDNVKYLKQYSPYNITPGLKEELNKDYDVLSVNQIGRYFSDFAIYYAKKKKKRVILTPHFYFHTKRFDLFKKIHRKFITGALLDHVDILICFTAFEAEFWQREFHIDENKIRIIPHYISFQNDDMNKNCSIENKNKKYFLYLGRNDKNKRIDLLIKAFSELHLAHDYKLFLTVREEDLPDELSEIVKKCENIKLLGYIGEDQKQQLLQGAEALVLPTEFEAFGNVILESSRYRKPILCSSLPVLKEIIDKNGAIFFDNNVCSIRDALINFEKMNKNEKMLAGLANYKNLEKYSIDVVQSKYQNLFEEINPLLANRSLTS